MQRITSLTSLIVLSPSAATQEMGDASRLAKRDKEEKETNNEKKRSVEKIRAFYYQESGNPY